MSAAIGAASSSEGAAFLIQFCAHIIEAMNTKNTTTLILSCIAISVLAGVFYYPVLPERMASHWSASGEADGYMGKFWGTFLLPFLMAAFFIAYAVIPRIDPMSGNIDAFRSHYNLFWVALSGFFFIVFAFVLAWNLGYRFNIAYVMLPGIAALFFVIGAILEHSKRNWFFGIRTPWTLSSDAVWEKTHRLGGKLFKLTALIALGGLLIGGDAMVYAILFPAIGTSLVTIVYSYIAFRREAKKGS